LKTGESLKNLFILQRGTQIRLAIICGLFVMIAGAVFLLLKEKITYAFVLAGLPLVLLLGSWLLRNQEYFPIAILFTAGFVPFSIPTGTASPLVVSLALSAALVGYWLLKMVIVDKKLSLIPSIVNAPAIGFIAVTIISIVWGNLLRDPFVYASTGFLFVQLGAASVMILSPAVMLLAGNLLNEIRHIKIMLAIMLAISILGIIQYFSHVNLFVETRGLISMWAMTFCVGFALFDEQLPKRYQIGLLVLAGAWVLWDFVFNLAWLAGWLPGFIAVGVIIFFRSKRLLAVLMIVVVGYYFINQSSFSSDLSNESEGSGSTRFAAWQVNWSVTKDHLLFGTGPAGYAAYYMSLFPSSAMATHSNYIDIISETGIVGTAIYFWMFGALAFRGWKLVKRFQGKRDFNEAFSIAVFGGIIGCIVIMAFGDWLLPFAYTQTIAGYSYTVLSWLFFGTLLALDRLTSDTSFKAYQQPTVQ
jgi:hypothetical protein